MPRRTPPDEGRDRISVPEESPGRLYIPPTSVVVQQIEVQVSHSIAIDATGEACRTPTTYRTYIRAIGAKVNDAALRVWQDSRMEQGLMSRDSLHMHLDNMEGRAEDKLVSMFSLIHLTALWPQLCVLSSGLVFKAGDMLRIQAPPMTVIILSGMEVRNVS